MHFRYNNGECAGAFGPRGLVGVGGNHHQWWCADQNMIEHWGGGGASRASVRRGRSWGGRWQSELCSTFCTSPLFRSATTIESRPPSVTFLLCTSGISQPSRIGWGGSRIDDLRCQMNNENAGIVNVETTLKEQLFCKSLRISTCFQWRSELSRMNYVNAQWLRSD